MNRHQEDKGGPQSKVPAKSLAPRPPSLHAPPRVAGRDFAGNLAEWARMPKPPGSAADARPDGRPYYIPTTCPTCGMALVLVDLLRDPATPPEEVWHDEWMCPRCQDGIHLDVPAGLCGPPSPRP